MATQTARLENSGHLETLDIPSEKQSQEQIQNHGENDAVPVANNLEEKQNINEESLSPPGWSTDPKNPVNWSSLRKWAIVTLLWGTNMVT